MSNLKRWFLTLLIISSGVFLSQKAFATNQKVYDQAQLFSTENIEKIQQAIEEFEENAEMEAIILTNDQNTGKSARDYADDFYFEHDFGVGSEKSGMLILIDIDTRDYWISTSGRGIKLFTDERIEKLLDVGESDMKDENYSKAVLNMLQAATAYSNDYSYDEANNSYRRVKRITWYEGLFAGIVSLLVASIGFITVYRNYNLKGRPYSYPYRYEGELNLTDKEDTLINTATTSRYIPPANSNNNGSGGSSTHTSSGGSTHGGGGRGF